MQETMSEQEEFIGLPVFAYDPEKPIKISQEELDFNRKLETIINSDFVPVEKKKSFFEKFEESIARPARMDGEHHGNPVIANLFDIVNHALSDFNVLHSPNFSGHAQDDRAIKVRVRHFLKGRRGFMSGIDIYSMRIGQCLAGLVRYAKYDKNFFGENNENLRTALKNYDLLAEEISRSRDPYQKAKLLHGMIIACEILFEKEAEIVEEINVSPTVQAVGSMMSSSEFDQEFNET